MVKAIASGLVACDQTVNQSGVRRACGLVVRLYMASSAMETARPMAMASSFTTASTAPSTRRGSAASAASYAATASTVSSATGAGATTAESKSTNLDTGAAAGASTWAAKDSLLKVEGLALYSSVFCMLGMNDARVMRPDANTIEGTWCANWAVKDSPVESSAPRPATKAICATRPLMVSGAQPPKDIAPRKLSFMETGGAATAASTTGS